MLGIPLEMVHKWWRVLIIYVAGVVAGSLGTSVSDPTVYLAGASGGVYALITAHVATIIMNWSQMEFAVLQLLVFLVVTSVDVGQAVWNRYVLDTNDQIGYVAHLAGAIAGLLVGINILRNLEVKTWEKVVWWASMVTYTALMTAAILWNILYTSYYESWSTFVDTCRARLTVVIGTVGSNEPSLKKRANKYRGDFKIVYAQIRYIFAFHWYELTLKYLGR